MSSHHFVKENQEPALLILNTEAIPFEKLQELLEWSPTVIVNESSVEKAVGWGIKIDVVVAPSDQIEHLTQTLYHQAPIQFILCDDKTDVIPRVIEFLEASYQKAINVVTDSLADFDSLQIANLDCELFFDGKRWSFAKDGRFRKWYEREVQLFIYPVSTRFYSVIGASTSLLTENNGVMQLESSIPFWIGEVV
jgi:hypothetical protein